MKIERVNIGEIIRQIVEMKGWSQSEFAKKIGMARQNVAKQVFGKTSLDTNLLCVISEVLNCNLFNYFKTDPDNTQELRATLTIEMGKERKDKTFRFVFGENNIEIQNK